MKHILAYCFVTLIAFSAKGQPVPPPIEADTMRWPATWPAKGAVWYYKNTGYNTNIDYIRVTAGKKYLMPEKDSWAGGFYYYPGNSIKFEMMDKNNNVLKDSIVYLSTNYIQDISPDKKDTINRPDSITGNSDGVNPYIFYFNFQRYGFNIPGYKNYSINPVPARGRNTIFRPYRADTFTFIVNNIKLAAYTASYSDACSDMRTDTLVFYIGSLNFFFPINVCEPNEWGGPLLCYYDDNLGWFYKGKKEDCPCFRKENKDFVKGIYPNPFTSLINIDFYELPSNVTFELFDNVGRHLVTKVEINSLKATINLSEYPEGLYYIRTTNNQFTNTYKIVKQ